MANFDFDDNSFDDILEDLNTLTISCFKCGEEFDIRIDDTNSSVTCPHCDTCINIESE